MTTTGRPFLRRGPSGPRAADPIVQMGYDSIVEELVIQSPDTTNNHYLPRNSVPDPLEVRFPNFTEGNILECDFRYNGDIEFAESPGNLSFTIRVSVDGGATFFDLIPSVTTEDPIAPSVETFFALGHLSAVVIQDPMPVVIGGVPATVPVTAAPIVRVGVAFPSNGQLLVNGDPSNFNTPGYILKCTEISAAAVFQGPLGQLANQM